VSVTDGTPPVPETEMVWGLCGALSRSVTAPVKPPVESAEKAMLREQLAPAATAPPQSSVSVKGAVVAIET